MNCLIYARVSTEEQAAKQLSIPAQIAAMKAYAANRAWTITGEFVEPGASGRTADRPVLQAMLNRCAELPKVDVVIVHKIDRLARSVHDHAAIRYRLRQHKIKLASVVENVDDSVSGQLVENIMASIGEFYSANLAEEVKKGMRMKVEKGGWPFQPPRGYRVVRDGDGKGHIEIDEPDATAIRYAFDQYATNRFSFRRLREHLAAMGFVTKRGKEIPQSGVERLLKNPFYAGRVRWDGVEYPGGHHPMVSASVFQRVQEIIASRHEDHGDKGRLKFLLRGVAYCAQCGGKLTAERHARWSYYRCIRRTLNRASCNAGMSSTRTVHDDFASICRGLVLTDALKERLLARIDAMLADRQRVNRSALASIHARQAKLHEQETRNAEAYVRGDFSAEAHRAVAARIRADLARLEVEERTASLNDSEIRARVDQTLRSASSVHRLAESLGSNRSHDLVRRVFKKLVVGDGMVESYELRPPFDRLLQTPPPGGGSSAHLEESNLRITRNSAPSFPDSLVNSLCSPVDSNPI